MGKFEETVRANICGDDYNADARAEAIIQIHRADIKRLSRNAIKGIKLRTACAKLVKAYNEIESFNEDDKYRWHDLRKNPDDLPNNDEVVLCQHLPNIIENKKELVIMHSFKDGKFVCNWDIDTDVHSETFGQRYFGDIIAWKEIEPFKMVE